MSEKTRGEQIEEATANYMGNRRNTSATAIAAEEAFIAGASWADLNPKDESELISDLICQRSIAFDEAREYRLKAERYEALVKRISGMCGTPDAAEGCRNILKEIKALNDETQAGDVK